jgi:hypothetical protein
MLCGLQNICMSGSAQSRLQEYENLKWSHTPAGSFEEEHKRRVQNVLLISDVADHFQACQYPQSNMRLITDVAILTLAAATLLGFSVEAKCNADK